MRQHIPQRPERAGGHRGRMTASSIALAKQHLTSEKEAQKNGLTGRAG
jgi:hypothetical protein